MTFNFVDHTGEDDLVERVIRGRFGYDPWGASSADDTALTSIQLEIRGHLTAARRFYQRFFTANTPEPGEALTIGFAPIATEVVNCPRADVAPMLSMAVRALEFHARETAQDEGRVHLPARASA